MIYTDEFLDEYKVSGQFVETTSGYSDKFEAWQEKTSKKFKNFKIISVQRIEKGVFVVWEK